jgi:hypothetical protein
MKRLCQMLALIALWSPAALLGQSNEPPSQEIGEPILVIFHGPSPARPIVQHLRRALAEVARAHAGALLDLSPAPPAPARAVEHVRHGVEAYRAFEYGQALEHLDAGLAEAARTGGAGMSTSELADLHLARALVFTQLDERERAWDEMVAAATLDPTRTLDPVRFPPRVLESFERASDALRTGSYSQFSIDVAGACEVFVDGRSIPPNEARPVPLGQHYVRVGCPGAEPYGSRALVQHERQVLAPALRSPAPPDDSSLRDLARERGARALLVARVFESPNAPPSASFRWLDIESGRERTRLNATLSSEPEARQAASAIERLFEHPAVPMVQPTDVRPRKSTPWHRRTWVWAAIGAAAATLALSPLLLDSSSPGGFVVRPIGDLPGS